MKDNAKKILIASPIRQDPAILEVFLESLKNLDYDSFEPTYYFIDDNTDTTSTELLHKFKKQKYTVLVETSQCSVRNAMYVDNKHEWQNSNIENVANYKNQFIKYALDNDYDFLFLIDSDLILDSRTITKLASNQVDIVSNIFWTQWVKGGGCFPQVWLQDFNDFYTSIPSKNKKPSKAYIKQATFNFINNLKVPGLYEVGGLGACTLINKKALKKGVNFSRIDNVSFWGEDRHFCIRARALGLKLYVDTTYPAFHIYHKELLKKVKAFKQHGFHFEDIMIATTIKDKIFRKLQSFFPKNNPLTFFKNIFKKILLAYYKNDKRRVTNNHKIVLSMVVKNEAKNYLVDMLTEAKELVDFVLILDDASDDNTVELCDKILADKPHKIIQNSTSMFHEEFKLRQKQWRETIKINPGWILFMDADDFFEKSMKNKIKYLIQNDAVDLYRFRYYDMWNRDSYRDDPLWQGHNNYRPMLLRYQPHFKYFFRKTNQHCGSLPKNTIFMSYVDSPIRVKHYGWSREEDRIKKYQRYMSLDKEGKYGNKTQYESILDQHPHLVKFIEKDDGE